MVRGEIRFTPYQILIPTFVEEEELSKDKKSFSNVANNILDFYKWVEHGILDQVFKNSWYI